MSARELGAILARWRDAGGELGAAVLATVVHVRGSAYRRPGARMLIGVDRDAIGTVSGGCLEAEVVRKAWWWTEEGPVIRVFDNGDEDAARDFGLGCNGAISVLLERTAAPETRRLMAFLDARQRARRAAVVATVIAAAGDAEVAVGDRGLFDPDGAVGAELLVPRGPLGAAVRHTFAERASRLVHCDRVDFFVEWVGPPQRLILCGAGHDAEPLAAIALSLGWEVVVADARPARLQAGRFAGAALFAIPPAGDVGALAVGADDAVVLMTHNFPLDARLLPQLLAAGPRYLGLLGPRRRAEKLAAETGADLDGPNVYAPVGLDLGANDPETIALAVAAEVQAVLADRTPTHLRERRGSMHTPALELDLAPGVREAMRVSL